MVMVMPAIQMNITLRPHMKEKMTIQFISKGPEHDPVQAKDFHKTWMIATKQQLLQLRAGLELLNKLSKEISVNQSSANWYAKFLRIPLPLQSTRSNLFCKLITIPTERSLKALQPLLNPLINPLQLNSVKLELLSITKQKNKESLPCLVLREDLTLGRRL